MVEEKKTGQVDHSDFPDPKGMQGWLENEIADIHKASELRIKEATRFVNEYARGEISRDEAAERSYEYVTRWGDTWLPGVMSSKGMNDEEILRRMNEYRVKEDLLDKQAWEARKSGGSWSR